METDVQILGGRLGQARKFPQKGIDQEPIRAEIRAAKIHKYIRRTLDGHPPLTPDQVAEIVRLLKTGGAR